MEMFHEYYDDRVFSELRFIVKGGKSVDPGMNTVQTNPAISLGPFKSKYGSSVLSRYYNRKEKRSMFSNISVKVGTQIYHLDKAMLALSSGYFEKLLIEDFKGEKCAEIELDAIDEDTFSFIVENIIYGDALSSGRCEMMNNERNFAKLFLALDYLQMEIDLQSFQNVISSASWSNLDEIPAATFQLYDFVSSLPQFEPIYSSFPQCFSKHFSLISKTPEFMSLSPNALINILISPPSASMYSYNSRLSRYTSETSQREEHLISKICAEWICHDFQNRLPHIIDLVNAAKSRFFIVFAISSENGYETFEEPDEIKRRRMVKKYFYKLLKCSTKISCKPAATDAEKPNEAKATYRSRLTVVNEINHEEKWKTFLKQKYFSDVSIRVGEEVFQLHRIKLSLEVPYFRNLFSQSTMETEHTLDASVDCVTFRKIVNYIYYEEINVINETQLGRLLATCEILRMKQLSEKILRHFSANLDKVKSKIFDCLEYVLENEHYIEHRLVLDSYLSRKWNEIGKELKFYEISVDVLEHLITLPNLPLKTEQDLLKVCSKWIHHDVHNRYRLIPQLALAINRNCMEDCEKYNSFLPEISSTCSEKYISEQLNNILSLTQPVPSRCSTLAPTADSDSVENPRSKPCFVISRNNSISVLDGNFDEIFSLHLLHQFRRLNLSAAIIEDNLFMFFRGNDDKVSFQVCNLISKKIISLPFDLRRIVSNFRLLNCNNTLYFFRDRENVVSKYSYRLNRWITSFEHETKHFHQYTSNGKNFFKVPDNSYSYRDYSAQMYNFEKKSWINLPRLMLPDASSRRSIQDVSIIDDEVSVLFDTYTAIYRQKPRKWDIIPHINDESFITFKQVEDSILYVSSDGQVYSFSFADESWRPLKKLENFEKIVAIHSV